MVTKRQIPVEERREKVMTLLGTHTLEQMANHFGVSLKTIFRDVKGIKATHDLIESDRVQRSALEAFNRHKKDCTKSWEQYERAEADYLGVRDMRGTEEHNFAVENNFEQRYYIAQHNWRQAEYERSKFLKAIGKYHPDLYLNVQQDTQIIINMTNMGPDRPPKKKEPREVN